MYTSPKIKFKIKIEQYLTPVGLFCLSGIMYLKLIDGDNMLASIILAIGLIFFVDLVWKIKSYQKATLTQDYLAIATYFIVKVSETKYLVDKIKNVKVVKRDKAETYTTRRSDNIMGVDTTPEKYKKYDINPEALYFKYGKRTIKIGEGKKEFNANQIAANLKRQINNKA